MIRKPVFWAVLTLVSSSCAIVSVRFFRSAYPIMTLDLRMNREEALDRAREIVARLKLPPEGAREAASFAGDPMTQNFIELEGRGAGVLASVMAGGLYHPYTWTVRRFKLGETRESRCLPSLQERGTEGLWIRHGEAGERTERDLSRQTHCANGQGHHTAEGPCF